MKLDGLLVEKIFCFLWTGYDEENNIIVSAYKKDKEEIYSVSQNVEKLIESEGLADLFEYANQLYNTVYK